MARRAKRHNPPEFRNPVVACRQGLRQSNAPGPMRDSRDTREQARPAGNRAAIRRSADGN